MIYRQTANPNATNSELDAKVIVKHSPKSDYEKFQEWLNDCPVKILDYQDFTDQFQITFEVELEEEVNNEEKTIDYRGNSYAENVDALVARMGSGCH